MNLKVFFERVVKIFKKENVSFALAGGLVASLYRREERLTKDLDFLIFSESGIQEKATEIIRSFGLTPHIIRKADLEGGPLFAIKRKRTKPYMILGRGDSSHIGLDFILPEMPWFESALKRAEHNRIDFGFEKVPCLTVEDVILAKLFSLRNDPSRFNDLDDLKSIFLAEHPLDLAYLNEQMQKLSLSVPSSVQNFAPKPLTLISKKIR